MQIPFRFRKLPHYLYDYDGVYAKNRIVGRDKRRERKKQLRRYLRELDKDFKP